MKKLIAISLSVVVLMAAGSASAVTIAELQAQIVALTAQLNALIAAQGGTGTVSTAACSGITSFTRSLTIGSTGSDVKCLQSMLNQSADTQVAASGVGSAGSETMYFGALTRAAVSKFQVKYGISPTVGYFGPITRAKANTMLGGVVIVPPVTVGGGLSVYLAPDTPASATVAAAGNANFTKLTMTAGTEGDVTISKLYVTRTGLTADADLQNIKIIDASTGGYVGSVGSLNVDHRALITFIPNLVISKGTTRTFYIRAGIVSGTTAGKTAVLGINAAADITSNATSVSGGFPVSGNPMSVVSLTIGSLAIEEDGTTVDSQPDVGATGVIINQFKLTAGSTETITIDSVTAKKSGTASVSDVANIELYDVTNSKSLGIVSGWNSDEKAVWGNLNLTIDKGKVIRFKIKADIVGGAGSSKTVNADLVDGTDVLVSAKGNSYNFFVTPTATGSWAGTGTNNQTIQNGSLNVSKSTNSPATGNVSAGSDVVLGKFNFIAKGEDIKVSALSVTMTATGFANSDITRVALYDKDNKIVAGPKDPTAFVTAFTDTFIIPTGGGEYAVKASIADSAVNGYTIIAGITTPGTTTVLTLTGMTSNASITATPAGTVNANTLTIAAGALVVSTNASPAGRSISKGIQKFVFANFSLDAGSSGEDVQVSSITVTDSVSDSPAIATDIDNSELWADLTSANSERGDAFETKISNTFQWTGTAGTAATQAFTLTPTLVVPKGSYKRIVLVADLNSGAATGSHSFYITGAANVTSNGATTGTSITETFNITNRQIFSTGTGALTIAAEDGQLTGIVLGNTAGIELAKFRLASSNVEDLKLTTMLLSVSKGNYISTLYLYDSLGNLLGQKSGIAANTPNTMANLDALKTLIIPANGSQTVTVKADLWPVDGTTVANNENIKVGLEYTDAVTTVGMGAGGSIVSAAQAAYGQNKTIFKARPYFAKSASSPTALTVGSDTEVARFDITASPEDDIVFSSAQSDSITFNVTAFSAVTTSLGVTRNWSFKMDGLTYADDVETTSSTTGAKAFSSSVIFRPGYSQTNTKLVIPKGTTKMLQIFADTSDLYTIGDYIKLELRDTADGNVNWSINSTTPTAAYNKGTIIFRGNIPANQLTK